MRGDDLNVGALVGPAAAERSPLLEMDVGELPLVHCVRGPFGGFLDVRRIGETRAVDIAQVADDFHDFGSCSAKAFFSDLMNRRQIGLANSWGLRCDWHNRQDQR